MLILSIEKKQYKLGILGGMGPEATSILFSKLVENVDAKNDQEHIECVVLNKCSIPDRTEALVNNGADPLPKLNEGINELIKLDCEYFLMPCNTAHSFKDGFENLDKIKFIDMVDTAKNYVSDFCKDSGEEVTLFCTKGTTKADIYNSEYIAYPSEDVQNEVMDIITSVKSGNDESENLKELVIRENKPVMFACTELSIYYEELNQYFKENPIGNVTLFDTMDILINRAIELCKE